MKKVWALILLLGVLLVGCGSEEENSSTSSDTFSVDTYTIPSSWSIESNSLLGIDYGVPSTYEDDSSAYEVGFYLNYTDGEVEIEVTYPSEEYDSVAEIREAIKENADEYSESNFEKDGEKYTIFYYSEEDGGYCYEAAVVFMEGLIFEIDVICSIDSESYFDQELDNFYIFLNTISFISNDDIFTDAYEMELALESAISIEGSFDSNTEINCYELEITEAGTYLLSSSSELDTVGFLCDSNGELLTMNDDYDGMNFGILYTMTEGTYYLVVVEYDGETGDYTLNVNGSSSLSAESYELTLDSDNSATYITTLEEDEIDCYEIDVTEAGTYSFYTTSSIDTVGYLYDESENELASNDDGSLGLDFEIEIYLTAGTYFLFVEGLSSSTTGDYTLEVEMN